MQKKKLTLLALSLGSSFVFAQVGVNTTQPQSTLDVVGSPANVAKLDGIIAPRLTGDQLRAKTYTANQTGAMVYVTAADSAPAVQTINVTAAGYYYFDGTVWVKQGNGPSGTASIDWHTTGNTDAEVSTTAETLGSAPASSNYLGTRGTDNLVLVTGSKVSAVLDVDGNLRGGNSNTAAPFSSIVWGSNNVLSDVLSSNVALGKGNTVSALNANFPGVAFGADNYATKGAKVTGNKNYADGANTVVLGNNNGTSSAGGAVSGIIVGNSNVNSGGFAFGTGNTVTSKNYAFGNGNTASGAGNAIAFGISATAAADQTVYANTAHIFSGQTAAVTDVGVNMTPSSTNLADLEVSKGILIKGNATTSAAACTSAEEGTIRYNSTIKKHEGCNGTVWSALY